MTGSGTNTLGDGIHTIEDGTVTLDNDLVQQSDKADGVLLESSPVSVDGLTIEMDDSANSGIGIYFDSSSSSSVEHLAVDGDWAGPPVGVRNGMATIADSRLTANPTSKAEALLYLNETPGGSVLIQRSVLQANPGSSSGALTAVDGNVTLDSSEVLGAIEAIRFSSTAGRSDTLTVAASTIDAGPAGTSGDASNDVAINASAVEEPGTLANVNVEGSIMLEPSAAVSEGGGEASVTCSYSAVPSQSVAAKGTEGPISCASGSNGNTNSSTELSSLFAEPFTSYKLSPSSSAIDSVPVSAITLPSGETASTTDLEGHPRSEDVACNLVQDKGALQLEGHSTPCAIPISAPGPAPAPKPLAGVLSGLLISPSSFYPAPSGATISSVAKKHEKKYGAKISYHDTQAATTTFTVLRKSSGRMQGKTCKKPSAKNVHGKRCTLLKKLGSFAHVDKPGANSLHFSGRIDGKKLPAGSYVLKAITHDAAGNGKPVEKGFTVA